MITTTTEILTIQKFVFLLDEFHYNEYLGHLVERNLKLSVKLVKQIRQTLPAFETPDELCKKLYGKSGESRLAFNQLVSYTFKQSGHLAINYPYYLTPNYTRLTDLVNKGEIEQTELLTDALLDIAGRIEDRPTQLVVLKFLTQRAFLMKRNVDGTKYMAEINQVRVTEMCCDEILTALRLHINASSSTLPGATKLQTYENMFLSYSAHESKVVRLLAQYAHIYLLFYTDKSRFYQPATRELMDSLEKDIEKYKYKVLPFGFDLKSSFTFYKLNSPFANLNSPEGRQHFEELQEHYKSVKFWNSYLNLPEVLTIATRASFYLTQYSPFVYRQNYPQQVKPVDLEGIEALARRCNEMLEGQWQKSDYKSDYVNLTLLRAGLLILCGGKNIPHAADELEHMLVLYQQHNFGGATDTIFLFLMMAYFSLKDYEKCIQTFARYTKSVSPKTFSKGNDIDIHIYFYAAKWLQRHSKQYLCKLYATYQRTLAADAIPGHSQKILDCLNYLNIPFQQMHENEVAVQ